MDPGDADILALLATDLRHSYERLISTYWHRLKVFVLRQVGSPQDAEDICRRRSYGHTMPLRATPRSVSWH